MKTASTYRPEIDGLRAVAVLAVILFHADVPGFGGGYVGVDVFFVISGYLITSRIVAEREAGTFSLLRFYERRARRILPALFVVLFAALVGAWLLMLPTDVVGVYRSALSALGMSSNFQFWRESGYWDTASELKPLLHTWSLGVEEQFYLLYPLGMLALLRFVKRRIMRMLALILAGGASFALASWVAVAHPSAAFYLLPTRAWELLLGACLSQARGALSSLEAKHAWRQIGSAAGLVMICAACVIFTERTRMVWLALPTFGAMLVLAGADSSTLVGRVLASRPLRVLGLISYSAYLIQTPVFTFVRNMYPSGPDWPEMLAWAALVLALAWLSWRFVELPFRDALRVPRRQMIGWIAAGAVLIGGISVAGITTDGFEAAYSDGLTEQARAATRAYMNPPSLPDDGACRFNAIDVSDEFVRRFEDCSARYGAAVVVIGDSHARMLFSGLVLNTDKPSFIVGVTSGGCSVDLRLAKKKCPFGRFMQFATAHAKQIRRILYHQAAADLLMYPKNPKYAQLVKTYLNNLPATIDVVWMGSVIEPRLRIAPLLKHMQRCELGRASVAEASTQVFENSDAALQRMPGLAPHVRYLSVMQALRFDARVDIYDCTAVFWADSNHWSRAGQLRFGQRLLAAHPELVGQK